MLSSGVREGRLDFIARRYISGWFCIDFVSCIPVEYIALAAERSREEPNGETDGTNLRALKTLRLVKLSKMLRMARIQRIIAKYDHLEFVQTWSDVGGLIFSILLIAHLLACGWYLIGLTDNIFLGRPQPGWVLQELCDCNNAVWADNPPLCEMYDDAASCPEDRCRWDRDPHIETVSSNTDSCIPRVLCKVGCETHADVSLTWRYITSMYLVLGSLSRSTRLFQSARLQCLGLFAC